MISIGALVEGTSGVEYCLVVSSSPGMVSIGIIGVDLGVAILSFTPKPRTHKSAAFHTLAFCLWHSDRIHLYTHTAYRTHMRYGLLE